MKYLSFTFSIFLLLAWGCDPLSVEEPEQAIDVVPDVLALVCPDTVSESQTFNAQISFPKICGGTFKRLIITYDTLNRVTLQPVVHKVPQSVCPTVYETQTVTTTLQFNAAGAYEIIVIGNVGSFRKTVEVRNAAPVNAGYVLRFSFRARNGALRSDQESIFHFTSQPPDSMFSIHANASGVWDTTFANSASMVPYKIGDFQFLAKPGITESGIIIIP